MSAACACWTIPAMVVDLPPPVVPSTAVWRGRTSLIRWDAHFEAGVIGRQAQPDVPLSTQHPSRLLLTEHPHRAVWQRPKKWRTHGAIHSPPETRRSLR